MLCCKDDVGMLLNSRGISRRSHIISALCSLFLQAQASCARTVGLSLHRRDYCATTCGVMVTYQSMFCCEMNGIGGIWRGISRERDWKVEESEV